MEQSLDTEETKRRFKSALRGARHASAHAMSEFVGRGKLPLLRTRVESKRPLKQSQNSAELGNPTLISVSSD
jgi:hypothetical protein